MEVEDEEVGQEQPTADHEEPVPEPVAAQELVEEAQRKAEASEYETPPAEAVSEPVTEHVAEAEQPEQSGSLSPEPRCGLAECQRLLEVKEEELKKANILIKSLRERLEEAGLQ